jgi:V/A-type H+-transporting ATPase subunit I
VILPMSKVRILGPRERLPDVMPILQDFGQLHLTSPHESVDVKTVHVAPEDERRERQLTRILSAVRAALTALGGRESQARTRPLVFDRGTLARWARLARRVRAEAAELQDRRRSLEEERAFLGRYRQLFGSFQSLAEAATQWPGAAAYHVILPGGGGRALARLEEGLEDMLGDEFEIWSRELDTGETGVLLLAPRTADERLEQLFRSTRVEEVELPGVAEGLSPAETIPRIVARFEEIPVEVSRTEAELARVDRVHRGTLEGAEAGLVDALARIEAVEQAGTTDHAFVVEGWLPSSQRGGLEQGLRKALGDTTVVEEVSREEWVGEDVPVVLHNPRIFRPFETLVGLLPLPRYGSIDPTPFLAIFFPMFFGLVLGDVGYGVVLGVLALVIRIRASKDSALRSVAEIGLACAAFAVIFGFLYGELFGDVGARLFGMEALALDREEALMPFLGLALAIGVVHIVLGLVLNLVAKVRQGSRAAIGPGVTLAMVVLVVLALLAAVDVLPRALFTPFVLVVLALFPILVVVEGILGPTELVSTLGHILSYARVMAVGTASVMMAVAANRMIGAMGSVLVGTLFALLFHLVNFALGVFSPTVHALRLHFVEFFGTFYSPGGTRYEPFGHWAPAKGSLNSSEE